MADGVDALFIVHYCTVSNMTPRFLPIPRSQIQLVPPVNACGKQISEWS